MEENPFRSPEAPCGVQPMEVGGGRRGTHPLVAGIACAVDLIFYGFAALLLVTALWNPGTVVDDAQAILLGGIFFGLAVWLSWKIVEEWPRRG